jgi:uncharacterized coiled-coil protein SlyX
MFENAGAFSAVFLPLAAVLLFLVLFEKKLIAFEDRWREVRKKRIKELESAVELQKGVINFLEEIIGEQFCIIAEHKESLRTQKMINSIDRETLRQERLRNSREVK